MAKPKISISEKNGSVRLRWTYAGKSYELYPGLTYAEQEDMVAAEKLAKKIRLDILSENFDPTLTKYKPKPTAIDQSNELMPSARAVQIDYMFGLFVQYKTKYIKARTLEKYAVLHKVLAEHFNGNRADFVSESKAEGFIEYLRGRGNSEETIRDRLIILAHCWDWAIKNNYAFVNPWELVKSQVEVPPKQMPKPFSKEEILTILEGFKVHPNYRFYYDFVFFLFKTGARFGEAAGLRWGHITDDYKDLWIGESVTRGLRKTTKTNRDRTIQLNSTLREMLKERKKLSKHTRKDDLVFPSPTGIAINDRMFSRRAWRKILDQVGVEYRSPYTCRHTFISHCIAANIPVPTIAALTGTSVQMIYKRYAGNYLGNDLPKIFD